MARDDKPAGTAGEPFLRRWSRRKQTARTEPAADAAPPVPSQSAETERSKPATPAVTARPEALTEPDALPAGQAKAVDPVELPSIEGLTKDSDYSVFLRAGVPEQLRRQALRKLWVSDPILATPDALDMHNIDYNAVPTFPEGFRSLARTGPSAAPAEAPPDPRPQSPATTPAAETRHPAQADRVGSAPAEPATGGAPQTIDSQPEIASGPEPDGPTSKPG
ncbi:MAG: DUF3306 domain-containing protein [Proteobacteria bacterium]|nr:DUF3306 domain-containing protein [Pseudomonadota bacterium]